jgi:hypothetical protein
VRGGTLHGLGNHLVIKKRHEIAFVIEAKIKAELQAHQDLQSKEFSAGYAKQLRTHFRRYDRIRYIVLTESDLFDTKTVSSVECTSRNWSHLIPECPESPIVKDLLDSLAKLQISAFELRNFYEKKMQDKTQDAADMFRFFTAIAARIGIGSEDIKWT